MTQRHFHHQPINPQSTFAFAFLRLLQIRSVLLSSSTLVSSSSKYPMPKDKDASFVTTKPQKEGEMAQNTQAFDRAQYVWPMTLMGLLRQEWNRLDECPHIGSFTGTDEREEYLLFMNQMIRGCTNCKNERESFQDTFGKLTRREKETFRTLAHTSLHKNSPITAEEIASLFANPPEPPYYVTLREGASQSTYHDGSDRFPFTSIKAAMFKIQDSPSNLKDRAVVVLHCAPCCQHVMCSHSRHQARNEKYRSSFSYGTVS